MSGQLLILSIGLEFTNLILRLTKIVVEDLLWEKEKYWQAQLFTNLCGMNNINDLYCMKKKGYRK